MNGKKQIPINIQSGGGDYNHLQPRQAGSMQHPAAEDLQAQDSLFSDMRQIATNAPNGIAFALTAHQGGVTAKHLTSGGGYYPTTGIIVIVKQK